MFNAARLTQARQRRGWTKVKLAAEVGLTSRRIAAFEKEEAVPPHATIEMLARKLRFPREFFYRDDMEVPEFGQVSFRSLAKLTSGRRDAAIAGAGLAYEVSRWIEERFELPELDLPDLRDVEPKTAASALRQEWRLGAIPSPNLVHLLEAHGVRVFSLVDDDGDLDALSTWIRGVPFVFLTRHKSAERARWDAAHELGHLLLHHDTPQGRHQEDEANEFARHFLLPGEGVLSRLSASIDLDLVREEKVWWRVSAMAYIRQLHELGRLSEWQYKMLAIEASQAGYRSREDDIERERSALIPQVLDALRDEGVSLATIAGELALSTTELRGLLFSPATAVESAGFRASGLSERPQFRVIDGEG